MKFSNKNILFGVILVGLAVSIIIPSIKAQPESGDYPASYYYISYGKHILGTLESTHNNDADVLIVQAQVYWFGQDANIRFYFPDYYYDQLRFSFLDNEPHWATTQLWVIYQTGSMAYLPAEFLSLQDGYYVFNLDNTRKIAWVMVEFETLWFMPNLIGINMINLVIL